MDANSFFEYLIPALFFVFYIITKILESRTKKTRPRDTPQGAEPSAIDEVRREIQKKIRERQQKERPPSPDIPEMKWAHEPQMAMRSRSQKSQPADNTRTTQEDYLLRLKKEKARVEASRKEAQKAREASKKKQATAILSKRKSQRSHPSIEETLRDPHMARKAYLYHEIFGPPIALRKRGGMFPSWEN